MCLQSQGSLPRDLNLRVRPRIHDVGEGDALGPLR